MWIPILVVCSLPVSGAVWGKDHVGGVVGRAVTVGCHYEARYRSYTKYWCHGWTRQCTVLVETNGQLGRSGRVSITDNPTQRIFTVTVEDLRSRDTGWYSCGISTGGLDPIFNVKLQVSDEAASVPVLGLLSPANVSCVGGSVTVTCKSERGSLPISYTWYEKTSKISDGTNLELRCKSFKHQHHQYYCKASNNRGTRSSEILNVTVNNTAFCSFVVHFGNNASGYSCGTSTTETMRTVSSASNIPSHNQGNNDSSDFTPRTLILVIVLSVSGVLLVVAFACLLLYLRNRHRESKCNTHHRARANGTREIPTREESAARVNLQYSRDDEAADRMANNDSGIMYAAVQFQRRSRMGQSVTNKDQVIPQGKHAVTSEDNDTYARVKFPSGAPRGNARSPGNLQDSAQPIYASVASQGNY
uniref:Modular domain immune-type receptor 2 n=1 Tax=Rostroraja eglanteria TaxID=3360502 RepID=A0S0E8_ROSEG|nr:modular domain immune-type receptor 2 [Raja eglanteria]